MTQQTVGIGVVANDGTGDSLRLAFDKINDNFTELYGVQSQTLNAAAFPGATDEEKIQSAINQAVAVGAERVYIPSNMSQYDASLITFNDSVQMVREGSDWSIYDVQAYGAAGDLVQNDTVSWQEAVDAAANNPDTNAGTVVALPGNYYVTSNPFKHLIDVGNIPLLVLLNGARIHTTKQIKLPNSTILRGTNRLRTGIEADATFICSAAVSTIVRTSNIVTVTTSTAHGLEVTATAVGQGITDATFNGGFVVTSVPTSTSYTFAMTGADTSTSGGTIFIPLVVLGDGSSAIGVRLENTQVNAENLTNSVGVYSNVIGELSGGADFLVYQAYKYGIWLERHGSTASSGGPNNYHFQNFEVYMTPNVAATAIYIRGLYGLHRGLDSFTLNTATNTGTMAAGLDISGAPGLYSRIHVEHCTDGILIGDRGDAQQQSISRDSAGIVISGAVAETSVTTLVRLNNAGEMHDIVLMGLTRAVAANILVDEVASITLTDDYLAYYAIGGLATTTRISTSANVPWQIAAVPTFASNIAQGSNALAATLQHSFNSAAGQNQQLLFNRAGNARWIVRVDNTAEAGSDAGSTFQLLARTDAGAAIDVPIQIVRAAGGTMTLTRPTTFSSDISAAGGYRQTVDGFNQDNVAASQINVELARADGRFRAPRAGSVTAVVATATEARTAGTLTIDVFKNTGLAGAAGSSIGLTAVLDGTNTSRKATTQAKDTDTFAAGDELYIVVTTTAAWTPTTSDIRCAMEVET